MIDILLSTYNGQKYIQEQLDSIINQTYMDWCILIRDDGSSDDTLNIVKDYCKKYPQRIKLLDNNQQNLGSSNSFIELLKMSTSELIMFCDQDDVWKKNKLELFYEFYQKKCKSINEPLLIHSYVDVVSDNLCFMEKETKKFNSRKKENENSLVWHIFQNDVTGCTVMVNKKMRELFNNFDYENKIIIQHDWLLSQIAYLYKNKFLIKESTINYRQHANNVLGAKTISLFDRIMNKMKKGIKYDFYGQIKTLLDLVTPKGEIYDLLSEFANLEKKGKIYRCFWHIKNNFRREGNIFYFIYQLISC